MNLAFELPVRIVDERTDWPAWITAGATVATLGVVIVTAWLAFRGLRDARRTRHGQLITELMRDWTAPAVSEAQALHGKYSERNIVELVDKLYGPPGKKPTDEELKAWSQVVLVANLIEALGVLASEKAITSDVIYKMWGGAILTAWPKWDEAIRRLREYDKEPDTFEHFERLAHEMRQISDEGKARVAREATSGRRFPWGRRGPQADSGVEPGTKGEG